MQPPSLNAAMVHALADAQVKERFAEPEGLEAFNEAEIDKWWPIIKAANIKAE